MSRSLQNRLNQHEEIPPPSVWKNISRQLYAEFVPSDLKLSARLENTSIAPPAPAWEAISSALAADTIYPAADAANTQEPVTTEYIAADKEPATVAGEHVSPDLPPSARKARPFAPPQKIPARNTPVLPLAVRRIAVAAVAAGLVALGAFYLFPGKTNNPVTEQAPLVAGPGPEEQLLIAPADEKAENAPPATAPGAIAAAPETPPPTPHRSRRTNNPPPTPVFEFPDDIEQANTLAVQTVSQMMPVTVSAPPIRDEQGNLIMDIHVISDPGQPYIVVTSPNGDQTKISRKFLHYLSYLNGDYPYTEMNSEGRQWRSRFEEWRNELLKEASFIPTANNFFDIFQLKELIEDR